MSLNRYAKKVDTTQSEIVDGLRALGIIVVITGKPVDLACRKNSWPYNTWMFLEVKTPTATGKMPKARREQHDQNIFCELFKIPKVTNLEQALQALNGR